MLQYNILIVLFIFVCLINFGEAQYDDVRCKCVCPKDTLENNIIVRYVHDVDKCTCKDVVKLDESICLRCQCKYEARNTNLIKGVIIFILIVLFILIIYMVGLWINAMWKPRGLSVTSDVMQERLVARSRALSHIDDKYSRWKASVGEQRRNVYDHHSMLS